jgi:hypothetical protein
MNDTLLRSEPTKQSDRVSTRFELSAPPEAVWQCLMFYEDVPRRPWPLLRLLLPQPLKSEKDKLSAGSAVRCHYDHGFLLKRINEVEPGRLLSFEVVEQRLGIERFARACRGSYELERARSGTSLLLTTVYQAWLWPRFLWRPLERYLCHRVHLHILLGMRERLAKESSLRRALSPVPKARPDAA